MRNKVFIILMFLATSCLADTENLNSFNSGELSPYLEGRADIEKYYSGCRWLENYLPYTYGAIQKRPGTKYIESSPGTIITTTTAEVPYTFDFLVDVITSPYTLGGTVLTVWKLTDGTYTIYDTVGNPPYIPTYKPHRSIDNYVYIGGGAQADGKARPTKIDSDFNAVAGWPAYTVWNTNGIVWEVLPSWDGLYVYVTDQTSGGAFRIFKFNASDGSAVWGLNKNHLGTTLLNDWSIGVNEDGEIFVPGWRNVPLYGEDTPAVLNADGTLKKDYYLTNGSAATSVGLRGVLSVGGKWYPYGNARYNGIGHTCGIMQCFNDTGRVWNLEPYGANSGIGRCTGAVYYDGYFYLSTSTQTYDGGSKNCLKVDIDDGSIVASAYLGAATGNDIVKTPEGQIIFCTATKFIEIDESLNVLNSYTVAGNIQQAEYTPDWWDYWTSQTHEVTTTTTVDVNANGERRLIPFEYSTTDSYVLAFGDGFIGFYRNQ